MKKINIFLLLLFSININPLAQNCLNSKKMLQGYFYAGTSQLDTKAAGGFYQSQNQPKKMSSEIENILNGKEVQIVVQKNEIQNFTDEIEGFTVYIINNTDKAIGLHAQDSRLYVIRQVYFNGKWNDIEFLRSSGCGNSYHKVFAKPNEYWEFVVPCLKGNFAANFRFKLLLEKDKYIYSNEFTGRFNKRQLRKKSK